MILTNLKISVINKSRKIAVLDDGQNIPIVHWINPEGTCELEDAVAFVAGPDNHGHWYTDDLQNFEDVTGRWN